MNNAKQLRKEHGELKSQLRNFQKEHETHRSKMADKLDKYHSATTDDVQDLNTTLESLSVRRKETMATMDSFRPNWVVW